MKHSVILLFFTCLFLQSNLLDELESENDVYDAGRKLTNLDLGMHLLEPHPNEKNEVVIAIHGVATQGYEWVYPLSKLNNDTNIVTFYRWAPVSLSCSDDEANEIIDVIKKEFSQYKNIKLVGHSAGGFLVLKIIDSIETNQNIEAHVVASPLKGTMPLNELCNYSPSINLKDNVVLYEWRTQKTLDAVFKFMPYDPQIVEIEGSIVTRLPDKYKNNRLGHNWSISWVVDHISKK